VIFIVIYFVKKSVKIEEKSKIVKENFVCFDEKSKKNLK
jgi:hypothetical protein